TGRARASQGWMRAIWLIAGAVAMGGGIWSMHFIAMAAFDLGMPIGYDARLTALSFVVAVAVAGVGLSAVIGGGGLTNLLLGGVFMGLGIAAMHYTGMAAMHARATIAYDPVLFVLSVLIAIAAAVAALWLAFKLRAFWHKAVAAGVMGAAICGMHYTAMAAAVYTPAAMAPVGADPEIPPRLLAAITAWSSFTVLSLGLICSLVDQHFTTRAAQERLRESEERLRLLIEGVQDYAVLMLDPEGRIASWNMGAERLTGWREGEILGCPAAALHRPEPVAAGRPEEGLRIAREAGRFEEEGWRVRKDGTTFLAHMVLTPLYDPDGRLRGYAAVTRDITERRRAQERLQLLLAELQHRVKNNLAVVQALAERTGAGTGTTAEFLAAFRGRLGALAAAHNLLTEGDGRGISLAELARTALAPHLAAGERVRLAVAELTLRPAAAQTLALVLHELATNAAKYGGLAVPTGRVALAARVEDGELRIVWEETHGPPVTGPERTGFGMALLVQAIEYQHDGRVELDWRAEGLVCRLSLPREEATGDAR
ncbi:MAG TPA: MHYT domain-containing protein, partial [Geminicoccaceae bacterium]|nr:MHYT domain-containing protein [Geminicoccaceae bacterium]